MISIYISVSLSLSLYIYIYREREAESKQSVHACTVMYAQQKFDNNSRSLHVDQTREAEQVSPTSDGNEVS